MGALSLVLFSLIAARDERLSAAIERYESAKFAVARDKLSELVDDENLSSEDRAEVRSYLAACYLILKDRGGARLQLRELKREHPDRRLSPALFGPELITLADEVWAEAGRPRVAEPPPPPPPVVEVQPPPLEPKPAAPSTALAILPLGIGNFVRGEPVIGAVWLVAELAAFAAAVGFVIPLENLKRDDYPQTLFWSGTYYEHDRSKVNELNAGLAITFIGGLGLVALNVLVAWLTLPEASP